MFTTNESLSFLEKRRSRDKQSKTKRERRNTEGMTEENAKTVCSSLHQLRLPCKKEKRKGQNKKKQVREKWRWEICYLKEKYLRIMTLLQRNSGRSVNRKRNERSRKEEVPRKQCKSFSLESV